MKQIILLFLILKIQLKQTLSITSESIPKISLPPIKQKKAQKEMSPYILMMDEKYISSFTNNQLLNKLINTSQILVSNSVLQEKINHNLLKEKMNSYNLTDFLNWPYDSQADLYNLPLEVRKESDLTKWKRIITLLKSMDYQRQPTHYEIKNPPETLKQEIIENKLFEGENISKIMNGLSIEKQIIDKIR